MFHNLIPVTTLVFLGKGHSVMPISLNVWTDLSVDNRWDTLLKGEKGKEQGGPKEQHRPLANSAI